MNISDLQEEAHEIAKEHGWWEEERNIGELLALVHSEVSEALEEWREKGDNDLAHYDRFLDGTPVGFPIELADIIIRVMDMAEHLGINLDEAIQVKMAYNENRPYRHGGKRA
tara:strand:- start:2 stop:337 length:336 start_codon:yes stop_codon:yes gene_type:complete